MVERSLGIASLAKLRSATLNTRAFLVYGKMCCTISALFYENWFKNQASDMQTNWTHFDTFSRQLKSTCGFFVETTSVDLV